MITKNWEQPKHPSVREQVNKSWPIHAMESYAVIFKKHKTTRVNLKNIKQSQENPDTRKYSVWFRLCESQEEKNGVFHL